MIHSLHDASCFAWGVTFAALIHASFWVWVEHRSLKRRVALQRQTGLAGYWKCESCGAVHSWLVTTCAACLGGGL